MLDMQFQHTSSATTALLLNDCYQELQEGCDEESLLTSDSTLGKIQKLRPAAIQVAPATRPLMRIAPTSVMSNVMLVYSTTSLSL